MNITFQRIESTMNHTPTPWKIRYDNCLQGEPRAGETYGEMVTTLSGSFAHRRGYGKENIAFVLLAVNSHDALVEALKEASLQIEYLHEKFQPTGSGNGLLARINAALKDAE
jgi:hypothetical protein